MRRGELIGIRKEYLFEYGIIVRLSINLTFTDTSLKTKHSKRDVSLHKYVHDLLNQMTIKDHGYLFDPDSFQQSAKLNTFLKKLEIDITYVSQ